MTHLLAQAFTNPSIDWHAIAPEVVLAGVACLVILLDSVMLERARALVPGVTALGLLASLVPVLTLANSDVAVRSTFSGAFTVNTTSLVLKALFIVAAYVVVLMSTNYMAEGDYWESEYYALMVVSVLGMSVMASATDLITIFVALETLSIPGYMLAGWRKRDRRSNEAGLKYYLMGVFASAILLYGMSLLYGASGSTNLARIGEVLTLAGRKPTPVVTLAIVFTLIGFAFKVSAVPFHTWAPDTYEGAPTPVTAFLAVASKAAGFVALLQVVFGALGARPEIVQPLMFVLAVASMTVGNLIALRQTNVVRMLAYSGIAQAGFMLAPFAVLEQEGLDAQRAIVNYLVIYAAMTLGAFAVVVAVARRTRSAERDSYGGLFRYAPGLCVMLTLFLASLVGIPPLGGWFAKFGVMQVLVKSGSAMGYALAVVVALNTALAAYYYMMVAKTMWFDEVTDGDTTPVRVPMALAAAMGIAAAVTLATGIMPKLIDDVTRRSPVSAAVPAATGAATTDTGG